MAVKKAAPAKKSAAKKSATKKTGTKKAPAKKAGPSPEAIGSNPSRRYGSASSRSLAARS